MQSKARRWLLKFSKLLGFGLLVTLLFAVTFVVFLRVPLPAVLNVITVYFVFIVIIGGICWAVIPTLGEWTESKPVVLRWAIIVAALLVAGTLGSAIASPIVHYGFRIGPGGVFVVFAASLGQALPGTLIVGVLTTVIAAGTGRLKASQLALETQRLERERAEKLAAEAQLASLSSRVQPHFLFNTLNSIASLIQKDPRQAELTIERLASLLRSSLDATQTVPIEQEIKLVRDYLEIQKTRFGQRLQFDIAVAPDIHAAVLPFSVQSLVENSLKHVASQRPEGVAIVIRVTRLENDASVSVTDNGPGFDPTSMKSGRGLDVLQNRLRAMYGTRTAMDFWREPGSMTVRLRFPLE
jgi:signal transduction histidine kinase